ncbi:Isochorismatase-like protein [Mycena rebaudengoi]|nr:Isochorismatase-like protein [Mycena rebaudengoi]
MASEHLLPGLPNTALIVIDVQQAFVSPSFLARERSTPNLQPNITKLLAAFRAKSLPVIHIHHIDTSRLDPNGESDWNEKTHPEGVLPQDYVAPKDGEPVLRKYDKSSGFGATVVGTEPASAQTLKDVLDAQGLTKVVLVGQSSPHCVSSTARAGFDLELGVVVVGDACATYAQGVGNWGSIKGDIKDGKAWSAEVAHAVEMASLDGDLADVVSTEQVLKLVEA